MLCLCFPGHHSWSVSFPGTLGLLVHRAAGCCAQIPEELDQVRHSILGKLSGYSWLLCSQWEFCICCLLTNNAKDSSTWGKDCKQHPNNLWERIHGLGSAQHCSLRPQDMSSLAPALSAWTSDSHREAVPRSPRSGHSLVGRSSMSSSGGLAVVSIEP